MQLQHALDGGDHLVVARGVDGNFEVDVADRQPFEIGTESRGKLPTIVLIDKSGLRKDISREFSRPWRYSNENARARRGRHWKSAIVEADATAS